MESSFSIMNIMSIFMNNSFQSGPDQVEFWFTRRYGRVAYLIMKIFISLLHTYTYDSI